MGATAPAEDFALRAMAAIRKLIVGLGNPGPEYAQTRHNAGRWLLDSWTEATRLTLRFDSQLKAHVAQVPLGEVTLIVAAPSGYMNESGAAVQALLKYFKIEPERALVAHDELDLAPGVARLKFDGGHGGQNGLRDIIAALGHGKFWRLRIGIGHPGVKDQVTPWVLGRPALADQVSIRRAIDAAQAVLPMWLDGREAQATKQLHTRADPTELGQ